LRLVRTMAKGMTMARIATTMTPNAIEKPLHRLVLLLRRIRAGDSIVDDGRRI
jgi:hypothetical protein